MTYDDVLRHLENRSDISRVEELLLWVLTDILGHHRERDWRLGGTGTVSSSEGDLWNIPETPVESELGPKLLMSCPRDACI